MEKIRLGGIKIIEGRSCLTSSFRTDAESALAGICHRLAMERINITLLTHTSENADLGGLTCVCTEAKHCFPSFFHLKFDRTCRVRLQSETSLLSVFPHNERAEVPGTLLRGLSEKGIRICGFASSPSAMTALIPSADAAGGVDGLFDGFEFPTYRSPFDWYAAYKGKEQAFKEIICSYRERMIKVYTMVSRPGLEVAHLAIPGSGMDAFGAALQAMGGDGVRVPVLIGHMGMEEDMVIACCFDGTRREDVSRALDRHLGGAMVGGFGPVTAIFLHGPHFGDRYGITSALMGSLQLASVMPVAISCSVSSISLIIRAEDEEKCMRGLRTRFEVPGSE